MHNLVTKDILITSNNGMSKIKMLSNRHQFSDPAIKFVFLLQQLKLTWETTLHGATYVTAGHPAALSM